MLTPKQALLLSSTSLVLIASPAIALTESPDALTPSLSPNTGRGEQEAEVDEESLVMGKLAIAAPESFDLLPEVDPPKFPFVRGTLIANTEQLQQPSSPQQGNRTETHPAIAPQLETTTSPLEGVWGKQPSPGQGGLGGRPPRLGFSETQTKTTNPINTANLTETTHLTQTNDLEANHTMAQVTAVSQLADVQPTDWAFQALQSLIERYGIIAGYPDGTFRGNQPMSRYEFAAALNTALEQLTAPYLINPTILPPSKEDLIILQQLQTEFASELSTLRRRIDNLEARNAEIAANQFSTTTYLVGQTILGLVAGSGGDPPGRGETSTALTHLTQLQLISSFSGKDILRVGLATGDFANGGFTNPQAFNTNMALLSYQADLDNQIQLNSLEYRFPGFGDRVVFTFKPVGFSLSSVLSPNTIYDDAGQGAISRFGSSSPLFSIGSLDAGVGFDWLVSNRLRLQAAYGARDGDRPGQGLFGSDHRALGVQLLYKPADSLVAGLAYINAYAADGRLDTFTGSNNADISGGFNERAAIHAVNGTLQWRMLPSVTFGAWGGVVGTDSLPSDAFAVSTTYQVSLGIADPFGRRGDLLAFLVGQPPKLNAGGLIEREDEDTSLHYEAFYRFRVSDRVSITPGFFVVTKPGHIKENNSIFIGTVRTTFNF